MSSLPSTMINEPNITPVSSKKPPMSKQRKNLVAGVLVLALIAVGAVATFLISKRNADIRQRATGQECVLTDINQPRGNCPEGQTCLASSLGITGYCSGAAPTPTPTTTPILTCSVSVEGVEVNDSVELWQSENVKWQYKAQGILGSKTTRTSLHFTQRDASNNAIQNRWKTIETSSTNSVTANVSYDPFVDGGFFSLWTVCNNVVDEGKDAGGAQCSGNPGNTDPKWQNCGNKSRVKIKIAEKPTCEITEVKVNGSVATGAVTARAGDTLTVTARGNQGPPGTMVGVYFGLKGTDNKYNFTGDNRRFEDGNPSITRTVTNWIVPSVTGSSAEWAIVCNNRFENGGGFPPAGACSGNPTCPAGTCPVGKREGAGSWPTLRYDDCGTNDSRIMTVGTTPVAPVAPVAPTTISLKPVPNTGITTASTNVQIVCGASSTAGVSYEFQYKLAGATAFTSRASVTGGAITESATFATNVAGVMNYQCRAVKDGQASAWKTGVFTVPASAVVAPTAPTTVALTPATLTTATTNAVITCEASPRAGHTYKFRYRSLANAYGSVNASTVKNVSQAFSTPTRGPLAFECQACLTDTNCSTWKVGSATVSFPAPTVTLSPNTNVTPTTDVQISCNTTGATSYKFSWRVGSTGAFTTVDPSGTTDTTRGKSKTFKPGANGTLMYRCEPCGNIDRTVSCEAPTLGTNVTVSTPSTLACSSLTLPASPLPAYNGKVTYTCAGTAPAGTTKYYKFIVTPPSGTAVTTTSTVATKEVTFFSAGDWKVTCQVCSDSAGTTCSPTTAPTSGSCFNKQAIVIPSTQVSCAGLTLSTTTLGTGGTLTVTASNKALEPTPSEYRFLMFNLDNLDVSGLPQRMIFDGTTPLAYKSTKPSLDITFADLNKPDLNTADKTVAKNIQIRAILYDSNNQQTIPTTDCIKRMTLSTQVATAPPTQVGCSAQCTANDQCGSGNVCSNGICRNPSCPTVSDCNCPTTRQQAGCSAYCTSNNDCVNGLSCVNGVCRNAVCSSDTDCVCDSGLAQAPLTGGTTTATRRPSTQVTSTEEAEAPSPSDLPKAGAVAGTSTVVGVGAVLSILGVIAFLLL